MSLWPSTWVRSDHFSGSIITNKEHTSRSEAWCVCRESQRKRRIQGVFFFFWIQCEKELALGHASLSWWLHHLLFICPPIHRKWLTDMNFPSESRASPLLGKVNCQSSKCIRCHEHNSGRLVQRGERVMIDRFGTLTPFEHWWNLK